MQQFRVYKSSAGSGKTTTLVNEYLRICIPNPDKFKNVIALTFTIKATNEMKQRVVETLVEISNYKDNHTNQKTAFVIDYLKTNTKLDVNKIIENASILHHKIVHNYSDFAFNTLDSFVVNIVRNFTHELNLPSAFELELDKNILIDQAVEILYNRIGKDAILTDYMIKYVLQQVEDESSFHVENQIKTLANLLFDSSNLDHIKKIDNVSLEDFKTSIKIMGDKIKELENQFQKTGKDCLERIAQNGLDVKDFAQGKNGVFNFFVKLNNRNFDNLFNSYTLNAIESNVWYSKSTDEHKKTIIDSISSYLATEGQNVLDHYPIYKSLNLLAEKMVPLALLSEIKQNINTIIDEEGIVHISEMNTRIAEIVMNEPIPFIYERIGRKYHHFLVDEFQDTSVTQWNNLLPLIENNLASGQFNMIVGDAKQAIYRWRDGNVQQFVDLPAIHNPTNSAIIAEREKVLQWNYKEENLTRNFRSSPIIVDFNKHIFEQYLQNISEKNRIIYKDHIQQAAKTDKKGFVRIDFVEKEKGSDNQQFHDSILENIQQALASGFQSGDIAILVRKNKVAAEIANFLSSKNLKVVTIASLNLDQSPKVHIIIDFLRWLLNPSEQVLRVNVLFYLRKNHKIELNSLNLHDLSKCSEEDFITFLNQSGFAIDRINLQNLSLYDLTENILRTFGLNIFPDQFISAFLDTVSSFTSKGDGGIQEYLHQWDIKYSKQTVDSSLSQDAITLMTFHKSKGLEFPVVINAFYGFTDNNSNSDFFWVEPKHVEIPLKTALVKKSSKVLESTYKEYQEEEDINTELDLLNILYVAMTRPEFESRFVVNKNDSKLKTFVSVVQNLIHSGILTEQVEGCFSTPFPEYNFCTKEVEVQEMKGVKLKIESEDWSKKLSLKLKYQTNSLTQQKRERGIIIHQILSEIADLENLETTIDQSLTKFDIDENEKQQIKKIVLPLNQNKELHRFFSNQNISKKEARILMPNGKYLRPDRVIIDEKEVLILDFKISNFKHITPEIFEKYKLQLKDYSSAISKIYILEVKSYLLFIDEEIDLIEVL